MDLPTLSDEKRAELQTKAHQRMQSGVAQMNQGLIDLTQLASGEDYRAMQKATERIGEGLLESVTVLCDCCDGRGVRLDPDLVGEHAL